MPTLQILRACLFCLALTAFAAPGTTSAADDSSSRRIAVDDVKSLDAALKDLRAGDLVEVAPGRYVTKATLRIRVMGTPDRSVVIRARDIGEVEIAGTHGFLVEKSSHVTVEGFRFTHSSNSKAVEIKNSSYVSISRNHFRLTEDVDEQTHWVYLAGESAQCTISHNLFESKSQPGCFVTLDGTRSADGETGQIVRDVEVTGNHFRDIGPRIKNGKEAVRLGSSKLSMSHSGCVVRGNLFENCDGDPEVVSVKCCDATINENTFRDCQGGLCLRHGNRNRADANVFVCTAGKESVGGIRVYGTDHLVTNNVMFQLTGRGDEAPLVLSNGETDEGPLDARFRPQRVLMAHNSLIDCVNSSIDIGYDDGGKLKLPSLDCIVANNLVVSSSGVLVRIINESPTLAFGGNLLFAIAPARAGIDDAQVMSSGSSPGLVIEYGIPRLTPASPAMDAGIPLPHDVESDFDRQPRSGRSDVGSDEYSDPSGDRQPLLPTDVGPQAPARRNGFPRARE